MINAIEMLRASCDKERVDPWQNGFWVITTEELESFTKLVIAKDREQLAKKIAQMPFGATSDSFAIWIKEQP